VLRGVLGGLADQPRERHERERREHEVGRVARVDGVVDEDRRRCEGEERPEDPSHHRPREP
jgi:hypothetical protein